MASIRIPNIDEDGNFTNPDVLDRLAERFGGDGGGGTTGGITGTTTLDQAAQNGA